MRIATLVHVRAAIMLSGGPSALETCEELEVSTAHPELAKFRVRLANFEVRELSLRWEHGRWKVDGFAGAKASGKASSAKPTPKKLPAPPSAAPHGRRVPAPRSK